jgi:hypothetical protein
MESAALLEGCASEVADSNIFVIQIPCHTGRVRVVDPGVRPPVVIYGQALELVPDVAPPFRPHGAASSGGLTMEKLDQIAEPVQSSSFKIPARAPTD